MEISEVLNGIAIFYFSPYCETIFRQLWSPFHMNCPFYFAELFEPCFQYHWKSAGKVRISFRFGRLLLQRTNWWFILRSSKMRNLKALFHWNMRLSTQESLSEKSMCWLHSVTVRVGLVRYWWYHIAIYETDMEKNCRMSVRHAWMPALTMPFTEYNGILMRLAKICWIFTLQ